MTYFSHKTAKQKGRSGELWAVLTLLFGIFAIIALILLPKLKKTRKKKLAGDPSLKKKVMHSESAAPLDNEESFQEPRAPRLSANKSLSWYFVDQKDNDAIKGPYNINALRKHIHENDLDSQTFVWCEEFDSWTQINEFSNSSLMMDKDFIE